MNDTLQRIGADMHGWARDLFPINRSLTGPGVRATLAYLQGLAPDLVVHSVPSGTDVLDWTVPPEWSVEEAYIEDAAGRRVVDIADHTLHLVGYSEPVDRRLSLAELQPHLHSLPEQPEAIPYVTSYYKRNWGFCLPHSLRETLTEQDYRVVIRSRLDENGALNYGEILLPGERAEEVFLSTYICHPSMANNELSGPVVLTAIARWLAALPARRYSYRLVFLPETIGSITYISRHLDHLKRHVVAGFNISCIGDERAYSYLPSRAGDTLADRAAQHALYQIDPGYDRYTWLQRGSDERQYCAPGVDLPVASVMRSKYHTYPEYHTSLDDLNLVTPAGLAGGFAALQDAVFIVENNRVPLATVLGEPQLGKRGLYPAISQRGSANASRVLRDILSYADGRHDLLAIADLLGLPFATVLAHAETLYGAGLLRDG